LWLKQSILRLNISFQTLNFFWQITSKSPSSHTVHLFSSLPAPHLRPFSVSSNPAVTPTKLKVKQTG
ncbi:hypothetical protein, partial [Ligilactobacillus agilis]|uniref:hypothetical protein n=1 Tax=Ligilactobacillus agilis TaxID=1601 RepID=UPI00195DD58E